MKKKCTTAFIKQYISITAIFGSALIPKMGMAASILIYNTGLDNQSYPLAPGSTDSHYAVVSAPAGVEATPFAPYIVDTTGYPAPAWLTNNSTSQWISIRSSYTISTQDPVGLYDYQTTFDLTGLDPASAVITFRFIADNLIQDVRINGVSAGLSLPSPTSFSTWIGPLQIPSGFTTGTNTLDFIVDNTSPEGGNPSGVRIEISGVANPASAPPAFIQQPSNQVVNAGQGFSFTSQTTGYPSPSMQWQFSTNDSVWVNINGATTASYSLPHSSPTNIGFYRVIAANSVSTNTSPSASLTFLNIYMFAGLNVLGPIGANYNIQSTPALGQINSWITLTNISLPTQPYIYIDYSSPTNAKMFYRAVPE